MPIFEYICSACEHRFDDLVKSASGPHPRVCPQCQSAGVERVVSVFAAHQGSAPSPAPQFGQPGGCGRCGDPAGPCGL